MSVLRWGNTRKTKCVVKEKSEIGRCSCWVEWGLRSRGKRASSEGGVREEEGRSS